MSSTDRVLRYTAVIHREIAKLKHSRLPLPLMNNGDEMKFFCHLCNFRQKSVGDILFHYSNRHKGFEVNAEKILKYTSTVHNQMSKRHPEASSGKEDGNGDRNDEDTGTQRVLSPLSSTGAPKSRSLHCYKCSFCTQHVYLLKKHLRTVHKSHRCFTDILRLCFRQGALPLSYHCDLCIFSHKEAQAMLEHYQHRHQSRRKVNLQFVNTQLYTGTTVTSHKKKQRQTGETRVDDDKGGQDNGRGYPCRACSFKGDSLQAIASHYRAVHPWSVKEDGSVLDVISSCQVEKDYNLSDSPDTDKVPVKLETTSVAAPPHETSISTKLYKCLYCTAAFNSSHGREVHCRLKHGEVKTESFNARLDDVDTGKRGDSVQVYSCPHCTYVNTKHAGVTTHIHMKHPHFTEQDGPEMKEVLLSDVEERVAAGPDGELKCSGYLCSLCPTISASTKKLKLHCYCEHRLTVAGMLKVSKASAANNHLPSQAAFLKTKPCTVVKCPYCIFVCKSHLALKQHISLRHDKGSESKHQFDMYSCNLCPYTSLRPRFLGSHYTQKHGRAAFMKHYAPIFWESSKKSKPPTASEQPANTPEKYEPQPLPAKEKMLIYKCPRCTYVNISHHGTLTHCQMIHPAFTARADNLETEEVRMDNMIGCMKKRHGKFIFAGHMCKMCPLIYPSVKKMKVHLELIHDETAPDAPKLPLQHSVRLKKQLLSKYRSTRTSVLQGGFFKSKKYPRFTCEYCKYRCSTNISLDSHMRTHHKPKAATPGQVLIYKCSQCPYSSLVKRFLQTHYTVSHGRATPFKYDVQQREEQIQKPEEAEAPTTVVEKGALYECRLCVYSSRFRKYLSGHYKRVHQIGAHHPIRQQQIRQWDQDKSSTPVKAESAGNVRCIKCPDLFYDSPWLLSNHYSHDHSLDLRLDFTVMPAKSAKGSAVYQCGHCEAKIKGLTKLHHHLNDHRDANVRMRTMVTEETEGRHVKEAEAQLEVGKTTLAEASAIPTSPPLPVTYMEEAEPTLSENGFPCTMCGRNFMSMVGLRVHERSHKATDSLKKLEAFSTESSSHIFNKYIIIKSGNVKPFQCSICLYRTNLMCLWKSHLIKRHENVFMNTENDGQTEEEMVQVAKNETVNIKEEFVCVTQPEEQNERSLYLEPPEVQRQLNHYNFIAQATASAKAELQQQATLPVLYCEMCSFTTEHLSSIRRHYLNRHGKKLLRCKDCSFVTSSRKDLELHMEQGHSTLKAEPAHQKLLHCPLCLYQTKTRNNMIDHIVLHREERVVPMEVRRPKLSRYLQGIVFRCHNCTFTSASEENLRLHMMKHDDIRPYKCRLCYFDCATLSKLEAHLCEKHQVLRNHELVGQINLDQQEERLFAMSDTEENIQIQLLEGELEDNKREEMTNLENKCPHEAQAGGDTQREEDRGTMSVEENTGTNDESFATAPQLEDNVKPNSIDQQEQGQSVKNAAHTQNAVKLTLEAEGKANIKFEEEEVTCDGDKHPKKERDVYEDQAWPRTREGKPGIIKHHKAEAAQGRKFKIEQNIDTKAEDDILRHILLLDDEGSISTTPKKWTEVKTEVTPTTVNKNRITTLTVRPSERPPAEALRLTATHNHEHVSHKHTSEEMRSCTDRSSKRKEGALLPENYREGHGADPYKDMPVLENEYLKEEAQPAEWCEKDSQCEKTKHRLEMADETTRKDGYEPFKGQESEDKEEKKEVKASFLNKGALAASDGDTGVLHQPVKEENLFTCQLCGRSLMNGAQLESHILRHGM